MKAFRLVSPGRTALVDVRDPEPGPTDVVIRVGSASFCHSDLELRDLPASVPGIPLPVTLGHELAGWVEETGPQVRGWEAGQPVAVHIIEGCGSCGMCMSGRTNLCQAGVIRTPGVHYDGGVAERVVVDARRLVPLDGVDVGTAAPLTDAGMTAYHSIELVRSRLTPSCVVLLMGVGGLGQMALQILLTTSAARVIAVDIDEAKVELARQFGASAAVSAGPQAADMVKDSNGGRPVDVVLDFAGVQETVDLGVDCIARGGAMVVTGMGGGSVPVTHGFGGPARRLPPEASVVTSFAGSRLDLAEVISLAARGLLRIECTRFPLSAVEQAWAAFVGGDVLGRTVINP
jgi:alcohol dehydrogenase, propanol-preferring